MKWPQECKRPREKKKSRGTSPSPSGDVLIKKAKPLIAVNQGLLFLRRYFLCTTNRPKIVYW